MGNKLSIIARYKTGVLLGGIGLSFWEGSFAPLDWAGRLLAAVSPTQQVERSLVPIALTPQVSTL